ncbi:MAG: long-chain fatty acid--CoA ligase [Clostridia bacterium]|nr:long-chain fatty acid--CoA ligase [Clostridia bacterium]
MIVVRILRDFKVPNFKFPKFKMQEIADIDEAKLEASKERKETKQRNEKGYYEPTNYKTIKEIFERSTKEYENYTFILEKFNHKEPFTEITYGNFKKDVLALGTGLEEALKLKNKRVAIIGETTYHWYVSYMTMLCGNIVAVPIDKELPLNEIENVVKRSKVSAIIYSTKKKDVIKKIKNVLPEVEYFIQMNSEEELKDKEIGLDNIIKEGKNLIQNGNNSYINEQIDPEAFKVLLFTSGTTSNAKGVMLCSKNLAQNINAVSAYVYLNEKDRLMSVLPLHHTYESTIGFLLPFAVGASISVCEGLKYIVPNLKETKPTAILTVPLLVENLYKKINENIVKSKKDKLVKSMIHLTNALKSVNIDIKRKVFNEIYENLGGKIRIIVSAAAPIDARIGKWVQDIGISFLQGYGLTETAPIAALTPEYEPKVGSAGKAVICAELKIDKPNDKGEGEVLIKSDTLMLGYYEDENATKEAIKDGWFNSGDIGYLDESGYLYITGRSKNVIVTQNGKNIYPEEIELLLGKIEEIKESMVYGKEDKDSKELIISVKVIPNYEKIEEKYGKILLEEEIYKVIWEEIKKVNKKLTAYKAIKHLEIKKDEFEKTTTMKIKRFAEIKKDQSD